jgi:hypothetical protein
MRALAILVMLAACGNKPAPDARPGSIDASVDAQVGIDAAMSCLPSGGCPNGQACGTSCCGAGEACVAGTCMCGTKPACGVGDMCVSNVARQDGCGFICCGASGPCPGVAP